MFAYNGRNPDRRHGPALLAALAGAAVLAACADPSAPAASPLAQREAASKDCQLSYQPIEIPGSAAAEVNGFNDRGDIVGRWYDADGNAHAYVRNARGQLTEFAYPGASVTNPLDINDEGLIGGVYRMADGVGHGFTLWHGHWTSIDHPLAAPQTRVRGVDDAGELMGNYGDVSTNIEHGYIKDRHGFTNVDFPGSSTTDVWDGNGHGQYVGDYTAPDGIVYPYLLDHGRFTTITTPVTFAWGSSVQGINGAGTMVGFGTDENGVDHAIAVVRGRSMVFDYPGAAYGVDFDRVNDQGVILGAWYDADYNGHNFFARLQCGR